MVYKPTGVAFGLTLSKICKTLTATKAVFNLKGVEMEISKQQAREILQEEGIELSIEDPRSAQQFVTELLIYIEAVQEHKAGKLLIVERHKSAQSASPYFA